MNSSLMIKEAAGQMVPEVSEKQSSSIQPSEDMVNQKQLQEATNPRLI